MRTVYEFCYLIFSVNIWPFKKKSSNLLIVFLNQLIILAQNSQFFWYPNLPVKHWDIYYSFWNSINLLSVDVAVTAFGYINEFLIFEAVMIGFVFLIILAILIMKIFNKNTPILLLAIAKMFITLISEYLFIPTCILLFVIFKYSKNPKGLVVEYPSELPASKVDFGIYGQVLSVLVILFLIVLTFIYETCSYEIRYPSEDFYENRKIHAKADYAVKLNYLVNSYFFTSIQLTNYYTYLGIAFFLYSGTSLLMIYYVPYYSAVVNSIKLSTQLGCASMSLFFWLGYTFNNSVLTFVLTIFSIPLIGFFSHSIINYRLKIIPPISKSKRKSFEMFELSLRKTLKEPLNHSLLFTSMKKNFKSSKSRLIWVLQANFSQEYLNNSTLSLNKITIPNPIGFNFPDCYQVFKCKKIIRTICSDDSVGFKILDFFKKFQEVKQKDHEFCRNYLKFLNDFSEKTVSLRKLKQSIRKLVVSMQIVNHSYQIIDNQFPGAYQIKKFYGSLMNGILNNSKRGKKLISEASSLKNLSQGSKRSELSYGRSNFIIEGNKKNFGKVVFCNEEFLELLNFSGDLPDDLHLSVILPDTFYVLIKKQLIGFLKSSCSSIVIQNNKFLFLDKNGFIRECYMKIENISNGENSFFWFVVDPDLNERKEIALLSDFGVILERSKNFDVKLTGKDFDVKGNLISSFIEEFSMNRKKFDQPRHLPHSELIDGSRYYLISSLKIFQKTAIVIYLIDDENLHETKKSKTVLGENQLFSSQICKKSQAGNKNHLNYFEPSSEDSKTKKDLQKVSRKSVLLSSETFESTQNNLRKSKEMKSSIFSFRFAKYLTNISVLVLICIIIGIFTNIYLEINERSNIETLNSMQDALISLEFLVFSIRAVDIYHSTNLDMGFKVEDIEKELNNLSSIQVKLKKEKENLVSCEAYSHLYEQKVNSWIFTQELTQKSSNVISLIDSFVITTEKIIKKVKSKESYNALMIELVYSLYFSLNSHLLYTSSEFISCEHEKLKKSSTRQKILFYSGTGLSIFAFILTCLFTFLNRKNVNLLWELLRFQVKSSSKLVRESVLERLLEYHFDNEIVTDVEEAEGVEMKRIVDHFFSYILNFSLICLMSISIYLLVNFYFFPDIIAVLSTYSQLMMRLEHLKSLTLTMNFFTVESFLEKTDQSLNILNKSSYVLKPSGQILNKTYEELHIYHNEIEKAASFLFINQKFENLIHGKNNLKPASVRIGLIPNQDFLITESYYLSSNFSAKNSELYEFASGVQTSTSMISDLKDYCKSSALTMLNSMKRDILVFSLISAALLILFTNQLYIKSLNKEVEVIHSIVSLVELFPTLTLRQHRLGKISS